MNRTTANGRRRRGALVALALGWVAPSAFATPLEVALRGVVRDESGEPLAGVSVKTFVDGFLQSSALAGDDGAYSVSWTGESEDDPTIVVWWLPVAGGQVPELALLRESDRARSLGLWGPCIPRLPAHPDSDYNVVLYPEAEKLRLLSEADCMKSVPSVR